MAWKGQANEIDKAVSSLTKMTKANSFLTTSKDLFTKGNAFKCLNQT